MKNNSPQNHFSFLPFIAAIAVAISCSISQASFENSTAVGVESKQSKIRLLNGLNYSFTTDVIDNNDQKIYRHGINYIGTLFYEKSFYAQFGAGAAFTSLDNSIQQNDNGALEFSNARIAIGTQGHQLYKSEKDSLSIFGLFSNSIPLSEVSRNEGYKSIPFINVDMAYRRGGLGLILSGRQTYIWNSYDTNTLGTFNPEWESSARVTLRYDWKRFRFQYSYAAITRTFIDGSTLGGSGNSFLSLYQFTPKFWAGLTSRNISNPDEQFVDLWFIDPFVQTYTLIMGVTF